MKKIGKVLLIIVFLFMLSGCKEKVKIDGEAFQSEMKSKGYQVTDFLSKYAEGKVAISAFNAKNEKCEIVYHQYVSINLAIVAYGNDKSLLEETREESKGKSSYSETSIKDYSKYSQDLDEKFTLITRNGDTYIKAVCGSKYKSEAKNIIKDLGY